MLMVQIAAFSLVYGDPNPVLSKKKKKNKISICPESWQSGDKENNCSDKHQKLFTCSAFLQNLLGFGADDDFRGLKLLKIIDDET